MQSADAAGPTAEASEPQANKPAPTVMFDRLSAVNPALATEIAAVDSQSQARKVEPEPPLPADDGPTSRQVKGKPGKDKGTTVVKKGQRRPGAAKWGSAGAGEEDATKTSAAQPSSKKGLIIAVAAAAMVILAGVAYLVLRPGKVEQSSAAESPSQPAEQPAKAEPAPAPQFPALAAQPTAEQAKPAEPSRPAVAEKPAPEQKGARADKGASEKPSHAQKAGHDEKAKPSDDSAWGPAGAAADAKSAKPSEADYRAANEAYQRGNAKLFKGKTADAITEFGEALRLNPKDPAIHRGLGLAYAQSGNSGEAIKHLRAYLKAAPKANDKAMVEKRIDQLQHAK